jgi:hypothetical protein
LIPAVHPEDVEVIDNNAHILRAGPQDGVKIYLLNVDYIAYIQMACIDLQGVS